MDTIQGAATRRLTQQDLSHLVCPVCHGALQLKSDAIACTGCARRYPIVDGLAVLLPGRSV